MTIRYCDAWLLVLPVSWIFWPFGFSDEWALLPGPTFTGGFIHRNILSLTESKHSGGAYGTYWCDGCTAVTVFLAIHPLFHVTHIKKKKKQKQTSPSMTFGKPETSPSSPFNISNSFTFWRMSILLTKLEEWLLQLNCLVSVQVSVHF